jgi:hypothetical protein
MPDDKAAANPAPTPKDLKKNLDDIPDGPNVENSPWELKAARGETPLEGPRAEDAEPDSSAGEPPAADKPQRP